MNPSIHPALQPPTPPPGPRKKIGDAIAEARSRRHRLRVLRTVLAVTLALAAVSLLAFWVSTKVPVDGGSVGIFLVVLAMIAASAVWGWLRLARGDDGQVAAALEKRFPDFDGRLLTALTVPDPPRNSVQRRLLDETLDRTRVVDQWVSDERLFWARALTIGGITAAGLTLWWLTASNASLSASSTPRAGVPAGVTIDPGDVELARGQPLIVTATFGGGWIDRREGELRFLPNETGDGDQDAGESAIAYPMVANLDDPVLAAVIESVQSSGRYVVATADWTSPPYDVTVFEYPRVEQIDARITFPQYTGRATETIRATRRVSVIEGSTVRWVMRLNQDVRHAVLLPRSSEGTRIGDPIRLEPIDAPDPTPGENDNQDAEPEIAESVWVAAEITADESIALIVELIDYDDRRNQDPARLAIDVVPTRAPRFKTTPSSDVNVSPLEEFITAVEVFDDVGVTRFGIAYEFGDEAPQDIELTEVGSAEPADDSLADAPAARAEHLFEFESLGAAPDDLLSYHYWAEDIGPDGKPRRTEGDLLFAEVRPFEATFRQGQSPPPGSQPPGANAAPIAQLIELQKEILSATWNLRSRGDRVAGADLQTVAASQEIAIDQLAGLRQRLEDPKMIESATAADDAMNRAVAALSETPSGDVVERALAPERDAYRALLRLRSRDNQVTRGQSGSSGGGAADQTLNELELEDDQNRYETKRGAKKEPSGDTAEDREARQILSRLRELADRQKAINEQIADVQAALAAAETEAEKAEVERRLKRLRDDQRELLEQTDELSARMNQSSSASPKSSRARQQLSETRQRVREAAERLDEGQPGGALAAGRRAEQQFEQLRDQQRERVNDSTSRRMEALKSTAEQLADKQRQINDVAAGDSDGPRSAGLRGGDRADSTAKDLARQREELGQLLDSIGDTVEATEPADPLASEKLYEAYRDATTADIDGRLRAAEILTERGDDRAGQLMRQAADAMDTLAAGVAEAEAAMAGGGADALRQAEATLQQLGQQVASENPGSASPSPDASDQAAAGPSPSSQSTSGQESAGQSGSGRPSGQQRPGGRPSLRGGQVAQGAQGGGGRQIASSQSPRGGISSGAVPGGPDQAPITGGGYEAFTDGLRDVEELVDDADLRSRAAQIRGRAREMRRELRRSSKPPAWSEVEDMIVTPLRELRREVTAELLRRTAPRDAIVPIDRDPVPQRYEQSVRDYYQRLATESE